MLPIVFVTVSEHIGHQMVINKIVGRNFEDPGLHRSIIGDGVSTMLLLVGHQAQHTEKHRCTSNNKDIQYLCYWRCSGYSDCLIIYW